jgi:ligand-binding sensor domain-containing protein/signal transduction histidine kinase
MFDFPVAVAASRTRALALAALALGCAGPAAALDPSREISQYAHETWTTRDGLPHDRVHAVLQTRDGYLWVGTQAGLARFDGVRFVVFDPRNTPELRSGAVLSLAEAHDGALWMGTYGGGVTRLKDGRFTTFTTRDGLPNDFVWSVLVDRQGDLWLGTGGGGVARLRDGRFEVFEGLSDGMVSGLHETRDGRLLAATSAGTGQLRGGRFEMIDRLPAFCATDEADGAVWIGTQGRGAVRLQRDERSILRTVPVPFHDAVKALLPDPDGNLWIGTDAGLVRRSPRGLDHYTRRDGLSGGAVSAIAQDREGGLWVGTSRGLNYFRDVDLSFFGPAQGLSNDIALCVLEDRNGVLWAGTPGGLNRIERGRVRVFTTRDGLVDDRVVSLFEDRDGALWIGTASGLNELRDGRFFRHPPPGNVFAIEQTRDGALWVGTNGHGLLRRAHGQWRPFGPADGLTNALIRVLHEDRGGVLWVGTRGGGVFRYRDGRFEPFTTRDGLSDDIVLSIHEDADGALWMGTFGGGLSRYEDGRFTAFGAPQGLPRETLFQVLEDERGDLWLSSDQGVFRTAKRELEEVAAGMRTSVDVAVYGAAGGSNTAQCNGSSHPAGWRARDGRLWFPTNAGLAFIDPGRLQRTRRVPSAVIEGAVAGRRELDLSRPLVLPPGRRDLEVHYTALSFVAPRQIRFRYRLEGFDADWVDAGSRRVAYYTNLPPGRYVFRVAAAGSAGEHAEGTAELAVELRPHFFETTWFWALGAGMMGLVLWGGHLLYAHEMRARFAAVLAERARIARDLHDTLAQGVVGISAQLQAVKARLGDPDAAGRHLEQAVEMVRFTLVEIRRSVWDLRSQALEGTELTQSLAQLAERLSAGTPIAVRVVGTPRTIPPAVESELLHVAQEALSNAVHHARATQIQLGLAFETGGVRLRVKDDGRGFELVRPLSLADGHFGLVGMRERVEKLSGALRVESAPGQGTEVVVDVPVS